MLALCSPDIIQSIIVVPRLIEALEANDYKNNLMREFTVFLSMKKEVSGFKLFIQGMARDVFRAKTVIERYQVSLMSKTQEDDDDVIWISDSEDETKTQSKIEPTNTKTTTGSAEKKADHAIDDKKIVPMVLMRTAVLLGFSQAEVQKVYDEQYVSENSRIDELDFMNKLRQSRLNIRSALGKDTNTDEDKTRTFGSVSSQNDVVFIDFDEERMSIGPVMSEDTPPLEKMETSPASGLKKYGQMFNTHQFDSSATEKENKVKRISALIAAMPSSQKSDAMDQLSKIQATRGVNNIKANNKDTQADSNKPSALGLSILFLLKKTI